MIFRLVVISTFILSQAAAVYGATIQTTVNSINASGVGPAIGTVTFEDTK